MGRCVYLKTETVKVSVRIGPGEDKVQLTVMKETLDGTPKQAIELAQALTKAAEVAESQSKEV